MLTTPLVQREVEQEADQFLSRVSILTRDIDIAIMSVRLSVCPSVTFQYSIETAAQHIVIISSPHDSPIILVLQVGYLNFTILDQYLANDAR